MKASQKFNFCKQKFLRLPNDLVEMLNKPSGEQKLQQFPGISASQRAGSTPAFSARETTDLCDSHLK